MDEVCHHGGTERRTMTRARAYPNQVLKELGATEGLSSNPKKTPLMLLTEARFGQPIEELLDGPIKQVGHRLRVQYTTISRWKKRLGIK